MIDLVPGGSAMTGRAASWLLTYAVHSTLLIGVALGVSRRNLGLHVRDTIWKVAVLGGLVTASVQQAVGPGRLGTFVVNTQASVEMPIVGPAPAVGAFDAPAPASIDDEPMSERRPATAELPTLAAVAAPRARRSVSWPGVLLLVWGLGAVVGILRYGWARLRLWALLRGRRPVGDPHLRLTLDRLSSSAGLRRSIRLTWSEHLVAPVALQREICLPKRALADLDLEQMEGMLAHELAHIVRRDSVWLHLTFAIQRVLFIQPLNVVARRHLQEVAEFLCDELAVRYTGRTRPVAECLAAVADWIHGSTRPIALPSMAHDGSQLVRRVQRILSSEREASVFSSIPVRFLSPAFVIVLVSATAPGFAWQSPPVSEPIDPATPAVAPATPALDEPSVETESPALAPSLASDAASLTVPVEPVEAVAPAGPAASVGPAELPADLQQTAADTVDPRIVASLVAALDDADATVRKEAVQALGNLRASTAVAPLTRALNDNVVEVRAYAAWALGRIRDLQALDALVGTLGDDSVRVRRASARAIGSMINRQNRESIDVARLGATFAALLADPDPDIRQAGIGLVDELQLTTYASRVVPLTSDSVAEVRRAAIRVVGRFKPPEGVPALTRALNDSSTSVRRSAVSALASYRTTASMRGVRQAVTDASPDVREMVVRALGEARDSASVTALITATSDAVPDVRVAALRALRRLQMPQAVAAYRTALQDANPEARAVAIAGLSDQADPSVLPALQTALRDSNADVREVALRAMERLKVPEVVPLVIPMLRDPNEDVRARAARVLGEIRDESAVGPLGAALADSVGDVREAALRSLLEYRSPATYDPMVRALSDPSDDVRAVAAAGLGRLKDARAIDALRRTLSSDGSSSVRRRVVSALQSIGGPPVVPALVVALADESSEVRTAAANALGQLRDERAVEPLMQALEDPSSDVRRAAARALGRFGR